MRSISILGAGWLGFALAEQLQSTGNSIRLSKQTQDDVNTLKAQGWEAAAFSLGQSLPDTLVSEIAIINIPPRRRTVDPVLFFRNVCLLCDELMQKGTQRILFISTTSVYGEQPGIIDHTSPTSPKTDSGKAHVNIEHHLLQHYPHQVSILRLAGLVGGTRHPINSLAGKTNIAQPYQPVNLVHRKDVINTINAILDKDAWGETFLLCSTEHPTKQEYYTWAATQLSLKPPQFVETPIPENPRQIDCQNTLSRLNVKLVYPSPFDMIPLT
ncbi:oxidoreductase [Alteromonas sp. a30]|uniref:oxidoreductase n=1 Tax=Alteromonas sp. a30 TaxID=2730917 RepID=UPI002280F7FE|nr:oxidoreductase [Alteromonas sp. a30]MCY7295333.1 oxidoreductase [Alteromonas sp. a30]